MKERTGFLVALREHDRLAAGESVQYWNGQERRETKMIATEIDREPEPSDLPPDLLALFEESYALQLAGQLDAAEARLDTILQRVPDYPAALGNLAGLRLAQRRDAEAVKLLRRTIEVHPDYLFARCNLADLLIEDGELDAAQALLHGLAERPRLHIQEAFLLFSVTAMLHRAQGADESADGLIASLENLVENEDDAQRLADAKARLDRFTAVSGLSSKLKALWRRRLGRSRRHR